MKSHIRSLSLWLVSIVVGVAATAVSLLYVSYVPNPAPVLLEPDSKYPYRSQIVLRGPDLRIRDTSFPRGLCMGMNLYYSEKLRGFPAAVVTRDTPHGGCAQYRHVSITGTIFNVFVYALLSRGLMFVLLKVLKH